MAMPSVLRTTLLWTVSVLFTLGCLMYQDRTGPTYPLEGTLQTAKGPVHFKFLRSEVIGTDLSLMFADPVPEGITGFVKYRRFKSPDEWATMPMTAGGFEFTRRGMTDTVQGIGARLPSLSERAGKYEFLVYVSDGSAEAVSVTGDAPIYARYKAHVPTVVLVLHVLTIFLSMLLAVRVVLQAATGGAFIGLLWAAIGFLLLGGFVLGPIVQQYAFGVLWSGVPFGWDWTDNKVLVELVVWLIALHQNTGGRRSRGWVYAAGAVMFIVYFIPHSVFGSEYDYTTGIGRGTGG